MSDRHEPFEFDRRTVLAAIGSVGASAGVASVGAADGSAATATDDESAPDLAWNRTYGSDFENPLYRIAVGSDGSYLGVGRAKPSADADSEGWLVNVDGDGNRRWDQRYAFEGSTYALDAAATADGGYLVAGYILYGTTERRPDGFLLKVGGDGSEQFRRRVGTGSGEQLYPSKVVQSGDGGHLVLGRYADDSLATANGWVRKLDAEGEELWTETYGDSGRLVLYIDAVTTDDGYLLAGTELPEGSDTQRGLLTAIDADGTVRWERTHAEGSADSFSGLLATDDGGFLASGETAPDTDSDTDADGYVLKTDDRGFEAWSQTVSSGGDDLLTKPVETDDGYLVVGRAGSVTDDVADGWVIDFAADGTERWRETHGGAGGNDFVSYVVEADDGGYVMGGRTNSTPDGTLSGWLLKYGSDDGGDGPVERADEDGDGDIDDGELRSAIVGWSSGEYSDAELRDIIVEWSS